MDGEKFDDLLKRICTTRLTRFSALRGLVGGAAAALTGGLAAETSAKSKKKRGGKKKGRGGGKPVRTRSVAVSCLECATPSSPSDTCDACNPTTCPNGDGTPQIVRGEDFPSDPGDTEFCNTFVHDCENGSCTIEWCVSADRKSVSFHPHGDDPACSVSQVVVKGGNGANFYNFDPAVLCAEGLISPPVGQGNTPQISHFLICGIDCCNALKCQKDGGTVVCTNGPICDGCGGTINCPCPTDCQNGDDGPNNTCDEEEGICHCDPKQCPPDTVINRGDACTFDNLCCGKYECPCKTTCPDGTTSKDTCEKDADGNGTCTCHGDECEDGKVIPHGDTCKFPNGCCGNFRCPCDRTCADGTTGDYQCTPHDDGTATCDCTPLTKEQACSASTCGQTVSDGCCGTIKCDECCKSCTIGYYSQNQCRWDTSLTLPCGNATPIGQKCFTKYGKTLKKLLTARGGDVICAQAAAAYLNSLLNGNCITQAHLDICSASNAKLTEANEGFGHENCPLKGCGS